VGEWLDGWRSHLQFNRQLTFFKSDKEKVKVNSKLLETDLLNTVAFKLVCCANFQHSDDLATLIMSVLFSLSRGAALGFELRASCFPGKHSYCLSHSAIPFCDGFF
jgi:hypothetical protein